ncbi:YIP1 family protein [uncultured Litoreibacter sp.]|uniref:YIP1 family protein n=1 Tax=uncultured Litoreibacter sp. TaxID=1392394 RepID=UPI00262833CA|nr:YIP1 family protein [uncultured Litoreibacter sp.]
MLDIFAPLVLQTLRRPREACAEVLKLEFERGHLWLILLLVSVVSVLASEFTMLFVPSDLIVDQGPLPNSPMFMAVVILALLAATVFATHYIGRAFDGQGAFDDSLKAVIWMQFVMLALQAVQILFFMISPVFGLLFGWFGALYMFGVFLVFVQILHGFKSLGGVLLGAIAGFIGIMLAIAVLITIIAAIFGLEFVTNV